MGIFSFLKKRGNFGLIAENIGAIYNIIDQSTFGKTLTKKQKLYATSLIDLFPYISKRAITLEDAARAVVYAQSGTVALFPHRKIHGLFDLSPDADLVNLAMQLAALIFDVDTNVDSESIVNMVVEEKNNIQKVISTELSQGKTSKTYQKIYGYIMTNVENPDFQNIVLAFEDFKT